MPASDGPVRHDALMTAEGMRRRTDDEWVDVLRKFAEDGRVLDLAPGVVGADLGAADDAAWSEERTIPAAAIRRVFLLEDFRPDPRGLRVRGARIHGKLDLGSVTAPCHLSLRHCSLRTVDAIQSTLLSLDLRDSWIDRLSLDGAHVAGSVRLDRVRAAGEIRGVCLTVRGQLGLREAELNNPGGVALNLDGVEVGGGARLDRMSARGEVRAVGAHVVGQLSLDEAELANPAGSALALSRMQVEGSVFARGLVVDGEVRALAARISGQLSLRRAEIVNRGGSALVLDRTQVSGSAVFQGASIGGRTSMRHMRVSSSLDLAGARLDNAGGDALAAERLQVDGGASLSGVVGRGRLTAAGALIAGRLALDGASLANDTGVALSLSHAHLGVLTMQRADIAGEVDLQDSTIGVLDADASAPGQLAATGWQVRSINGPSGRSWRAARDWLDTADTSDGFARQPWQEIAGALERNGHPDQGRRLRLEAERRVTRQARWWSMPVRWGYGALVGYGLYPLVAGAWLLVAALITLGLAAFFPAHFAPTDLEAATAGTGLTAATAATACAELATGYPCFSPLVYGLEVMLPVAQVGQVAAWTPQPTALAASVVALRAFVWLMTALLLAGVTGLLRRS